MHYVRLLKSPTISRSGKKLLMELIFTINTDLGDSFLYPDEPIDLAIDVQMSSASDSIGHRVDTQGKLQWRAGMRVIKQTIEITGDIKAALRDGDKVEMSIGAKFAVDANGVNKILHSVVCDRNPKGQIMPVWFRLKENETDVDVCTRRLYLNSPGDPDAYVEFEEELGESIARHIWDAGVISFSALANGLMLPTPDPVEPCCVKTFKDLLGGRKKLNILELGCGIGVLGVGLSVIYPRMQPPSKGKCTILMTDLEDAEARARSNISRLNPQWSRKTPSGGPVELLYENLDWEDGRKGRFGPEASSRHWDLIMLSDCTYNTDSLPLLVETLSALHSSNKTHASSGERVSTKVFLVTKPRHSSEQVVFDLLSREGWKELDKQVLPLPVLGAEAQSVELYLFEKP